jgi:hypothetical protein
VITAPTRRAARGDRPGGFANRQERPAGPAFPTTTQAAGAAETLHGGDAEGSAPVGHDASQPRAGAPRVRAVQSDSGEQPPGTKEPRPHPDFPGTSLPAKQDTAGTAPGPDAVVCAQAVARVDPGTATGDQSGRPVSRWPLLLLAAPAFVAVWSGWVGLGSLAGFGMVHPLPGIADEFSINSAITRRSGQLPASHIRLRRKSAPRVCAGCGRVRACRRREPWLV